MPPKIFLLAAPFAAAVAFVLLSVDPASAQALLCPPVAAAAGRPCEFFHYHVQLFRPDTREFTEFSGINQFASAAACDRARDAEFKRNIATVEYLHAQRRDWWQADHIGPCHCDMTVEKASPNVLTDVARMQQVRDASEIRARVRERLLDAKAPSDAEIIRPTLTATPLIGGPKMIPMPAPVVASITTNSPDDLRLTRAVDTTPSSSAALDLPLVDIASPGVAVADTVPGSTATPIATPTPSTQQTAADPGTHPAPVAAPSDANRPSSAEPQPATAQAPAQPPTAQPQPAPLSPVSTPVVIVDDPDLPVPEDVADAFVSYESQRIQNVLKVSGSIGDETVKAQVLEACTQRIQLLSNLRSIIVGAGAKSHLVASANAAKKESERLAVVSRLFGSDIAPHWAPKDAADVIFDPRVTDAEHVLRDAAASDEQKRHALYALLVTSSLTEQQQLWLNGVVEALLR